MKNLIKISVLALAATALMVSCQRETSFEEQQPAEKVVRTFTCTFAQPADTKIAVAEDGKTTWKVGDEIMIHGGTDGAARQKVTLTANDISADGKKATITVEIDPYSRPDVCLSGYYAQYPASLVPEGNLYYECRFTGTDDFLMAACDVEDAFVFYNLCGVISYKVSGDFDKVVFSGNNSEIVSYGTVYQVRVRNESSGLKVNYNKPGNGSGDPVAKKTNEYDVVSDGTTVNYVFLPAGAKFAGGFTFKFYKGENLVKVASTETAVEVGPGKLLALGDISSHLEDYVAPSTSDHKSAITNATSLADKQANCFVITAAGAYKFPALKGNSEEEAGNVFGAEIVWETYNNAEDVTANSIIAAVDFEDNWIYFKTPDTLKPGNALIAAKDSNDKIIWSWHIWIPATAITTNTYGIYDKELMDRNLGALVAATTSSVPVESFGLHYEWGRKDPFVGARGLTDSNFAKVSGTAISPGYEMTVAQTIANPATYAVFTEADSWGNWLTPFDNTLWQDNTKTMYDPCPAGYRVPKYNSSQPWHSSDLSAVTGWSDVAAAGDNAAYFTLGDPVTVFPYCGLVCENGKYMDYPGARSFTWMAHCSSSSGSGYIMDVRFNTSTHKQTSTVTARGCSVRCVAE